MKHGSLWASLTGKRQEKPSKLGVWVGDLLTSTEWSGRAALEEDREITRMCDELRFQRIHLLGQIGAPECNGRYSPRQQQLMNAVEELECKEQNILKQTEVANLEPLGHNIGRRWKKGR